MPGFFSTTKQLENETQACIPHASFLALNMSEKRMPPFSFLKRLWPRNERALTDSFAHPAEQMITPEIKRYLENHNWRNLRYPPYQEGYPGLVPGQWFMRNYQEELYDRIVHSVGMPAGELKLYVEPILANFAELAHMLPASENHHHSGPGGLLRHSLEVASLTLDGCLTTAFDTNETPARRSMRLRRWYVAGIASGLLHDAGKPLTDIRATDFEGNNQWIYAQETLHDWSVRNRLTRYFLHWNPNRHGHHVQVSVAQATRIIPPAVQAWLIEGGHDIYEAMLDAISGTGSSPLTDLVKWADSASTKRDLNRGSNNGGGNATGVPVPRLVSDAMLRLLSDGSWKINTPAGRVWVATDGVYIAWNQGAEEIVSMLVGDGVVAIPRSPDTLIGTLVEHGIAERAPSGDLYWLVTPHLLRKNGKGPALRCMKLVNPDILFPTTPIPPPVSISLGKEGKQKDVIAPNDQAGAAANAINERQEDLFGADLTGDSSEDTDAGEAGTPPNESASTKPGRKKKAAPRQAAPVPTAPTSGVSLKQSAVPTEDVNQRPAPAEVDGTINSVPEQPVDDVDEQAPPEPPVSLEDMLLFLSPHSQVHERVEQEPLPVVVPERDTEAGGASTSGSPGKESKELLPRQEKISLNSIMGHGRRSSTTAHSIEPKEKIVKKETSPVAEEEQLASSSLPGDVMAKLTSHECYLLEQQPVLAQKLITAAKDSDNAALARNKVFLRLGKSTFLAEDIHPLVNAGWLWQDITVEGPALTRTLQSREGFMLTADLSVIYCKLAALDWAIPHLSHLREADIPSLELAVKSVMEKAVHEEIGGSPVLSLTTFMLSNVAEQYGITSTSLENAVFCFRDAVKVAKRRKIFVRPLNEELPKK
ncbi:MobH family relaxase (plasmid) [Pseudomonas corrugata]|uniref:MobH family relaxase n=1 Tax=Pseudomonas corrugata TaxID=47879 RepID=UPI003D81C393